MVKNKQVCINLILKLKRLFSIFKVDYSFLLLMIIYICLGEFLIYFYYVVFILLHELSHFLVARKQGYLPEKVRLSFFGASLEGYDDFISADETKIVMAGPLFNLGVVILCYLSFWFYPESFIFLQDILQVNLSILFFNFIPIYPLDMGRLFLCLLSVKTDRRNALKCIKNISFILIIVLFCVFILSFFFVFNFTFGFVLVNLCVLLFSSATGTSYKRDVCFYKKLTLLKRGLTERVFYFLVGTETYKLLKKLDRDYYSRFVFVDDNFNIISQATERELLVSLGLL